MLELAHVQVDVVGVPLVLQLSHQGVQMVVIKRVVHAYLRQEPQLQQLK